MSAFNRIIRYWHTVRYLRPVQIYGRLWFRFYRPAVQNNPAPEMRSAQNAWRPCLRPGSQIGPSTFRFLGVERDLMQSADWNRTDWPKLWLYNLHYFDDLVADGAAGREEWHRALIARWIEENPPASGNGWEPYPISLRLVNWCKWLLAGNEPVPGMLDSMAVQARFLRRRLEHHLLGNHLWANLKALICCGAFFEGREADRWREHALRLFRRELQEQILSDGGHFECSPMYHAILLEDLLDLVQVSRCVPGVLPAADVETWRTTAGRMLDWLRVMSHPDGKIGFFNDAAFGIARDVRDLSAYAEAIGLGAQTAPVESSIHLAESGYARLSNGPAVLLADLAAVGPDYLPGHAHADTLSFELSLSGQRVLVNGGTSTYEANRQRQLERSTCLHNTVEVDGQDSSEVWGAFRVARRARVFDVAFEESDKTVSASAAHDGYKRLPGRVIHRRHWRLGRDELKIEDRLEGNWRQAVARVRLAQGFHADLDGDGWGRIHGHGLDIRWQVDGGDVRIEDGEWHPEFGATVPCRLLVVEFRADRVLTRFEWKEGVS